MLKISEDRSSGIKPLIKKFHLWLAGAGLGLFLVCGLIGLSLAVGGWYYVKPLFDKRYTLFPVQRDGKWGYINQAGDVAIALQYDEAQPFQEGLAAVKVRDRWGYINPLEKFVRNPDLMDATAFSEGYAAISLDERWGYLDKKGKIVVHPIYDCASSFSDGLAAVRLGSRWGYIDKTGKMIIPPQFDLAGNFSNGLAVVVFVDRMGYIDKTSKMAVNPRYDYPGKTTSEQGCPVQIDERFGYVDGLALVMQDGKFGFVDGSGREVIPPQYSNGWKFSEGVAAVEDAATDKWGFIQSDGKFYIEPLPDEARSFIEGMAAVRINKNWGFIDRDAKMSVPPQFESVGDFSHERALVQRNGEIQYIDSGGTTIFSTTLNGNQLGSLTTQSPDAGLAAFLGTAEPTIDGTTQVFPPILLTSEPSPQGGVPVEMMTITPGPVIIPTATPLGPDVIPPSITPSVSSTKIPEPSPSVTPDNQTEKAPGIGFDFIDKPTSIIAGKSATVKIKTVANAWCMLTNVLPDKNSSSISGMTNMYAAEDGLCSWTLQTSTNTTPGEKKFSVTSNSENQEFTFTVTAP